MQKKKKKRRGSSVKRFIFDRMFYKRSLTFTENENQSLTSRSRIRKRSKHLKMISLRTIMITVSLCFHGENKEKEEILCVDIKH